MNIAEHIERGAGAHPERIALVFERQTWTYKELNERSSQAAGLFARDGLSAGDRIALYLPNVPEFAIAYLGILKLGAIAVSISTGWKYDELHYVLKNCEARAVVTMPELRENLSAASVEHVYVCDEAFAATLMAAEPLSGARAMQPHDPAAIVYTSGTTGRPKGAVLSHSNVVRNIEAKQRYLGIRPDDRGILFLPLYHCFGQNAIFNAMLQSGAAVVLHRRFDLEQVLRSIADHGVTMFFGVPANFIVLLARRPLKEVAGVRYWFSAAAPLPLEIESAWQEMFGAPIFQGYGLSETSPFASYNHLSDHRPGSIGVPIDGVEMKILDPASGAECAEGEKGEIVVRGHNVMLGYWGRPEETELVMRGGWFHTGDIGRRDADSYFYVEDRLSDMVILGGVNVYPAEVENVLHSHPAVAEAAVYGIREPLLGEQVRADIVLRPTAVASEHEIRRYCRQRMAEVKVPAIVRFVQEIPKSPTGKILKRVLRQQAADRTLNRTRKHVSEEAAKRWILDWLADNLETPPPTNSPDIALADLGLDSMRAVLLVQSLNAWLGIDLEPTAPWTYSTTTAMARCVASGPNDQGASSTLATKDQATEALVLAELNRVNR
ncbi:MAG: AMP-binding protein [Xanthobacteraceae bacterium]